MDQQTLPARSLSDGASVGVENRPVDAVSGVELTTADLERTLVALRGLGR